VTFEAYQQAKQPILAHQRDGDAALLNVDCPAVSTWTGLGRGRKLRFSTRGPVERGAWLDGQTALWRDGGAAEPLFSRADLRLPGSHNVGNALAAAGAAALCGVPLGAIGPRLREFAGLEHRLERVRRLDGVVYYNDSKATTPEAAVAALQAFEQSVVLIAGGSDKHLAFDALGAAIRERARAAVLLGATAERLRQAIGPRPGLTVATVPDLRSAVGAARELARPGDVVLLSPACASYGMFENFEERGRQFKSLVRELEPCCE
jgi:UDP-N-acetylmuramoylalanine--D-glutamate ligase